MWTAKNLFVLDLLSVLSKSILMALKYYELYNDEFLCFIRDNIFTQLNKNQLLTILYVVQ
jgi:hypothetical protein